jgi:hypothetical protein
MLREIASIEYPDGDRLGTLRFTGGRSCRFFDDEPFAHLLNPDWQGDGTFESVNLPDHSHPMLVLASWGGIDSTHLPEFIELQRQRRAEFEALLATKAEHNTMTTVADPSTLPDQINTAGGAKGWRVADGAFARGRQDDGNLETRKAFLGYLKRVGIHEANLDDGTPYAKLECEIECASGLESIGAALLSATSGKPSYTQCIGLGQFLLDVQPGQLVQIEANAGTTKNKYGKYTTYVNGFTVDPITLKATRKRYDNNITGDEALKAFLGGIVEKIRQHPAYAERPKREDKDGGHLDALKTETSQHDWPAICADSEPEYLALMQKAFKQAGFKAFADITEDYWGEFRESAQANNWKMPPALKPALDRQKAAIAAGAAATPDASTDEYDPFADE